MLLARLAQRAAPAGLRAQRAAAAAWRQPLAAPYERFAGPAAMTAKVSAALSPGGAARGLNTEVPPVTGQVSPPTQLSMSQAIGISETVLMYLELGYPGAQLDEICKEGSKSMIVTRLRKMLNVYIGTQLYVLGPFGFNGTQESIEMFARLQMQMLQGQDPNSDEVKELQKLSTETWDALVKRAFNIKVIPELTQEQIRFAASRVSSNLQDPAFLKMIEDLYNTEIKTLIAEDKKELAVDKLQDALVPCYINVLQSMNVSSLPPSDEGYVLLQVCINQNMADPVIGQAIMSGFAAVQSRAPISFA